MDTMMQHVQGNPEPPSARAEQVIPTVLDELVLTCLAKAPADRPQDVDLLAEQLGSIEWGESWTEGRATQWWTRHLPEL
jgi:hypothetical protein